MKRDESRTHPSESGVLNVYQVIPEPLFKCSEQSVSSNFVILIDQGVDKHEGSPKKEG